MAFQTISVYCTFQDKKGFLWFGTLDGLNRYDGYEIKIFRHTHLNPNTLSGNRVTNIYEDKREQFWLYDQFSNNLSRFDPKTEKFQAYFIDKLTPKETGNITSVFEDQNGIIFLATTAGIVFQYNYSSDSFILKNENFKTLINADNKPEFSELIKDLEKYLKNNKSHYSTESIIIKKIFKDSFNKYWIATRYDGLYTAEKAESGFVFQSHFHQTDLFSRIPAEEINGIFEDKSRVIWIGTKNSGLYKFAKDKYKFFHLSEVNTNSGKLAIGAVRAITEDLQGRIWIGTNDAGLFRN